MTRIGANQDFLEFAYQLYHTMQANEINLVYEGVVTQEITKTFTAMTEKNMAKAEEKGTVQRRVFNVMVECLQNISMHADPVSGEEDEERRGIVLVSHGDKEARGVCLCCQEYNGRIESVADLVCSVTELTCIRKRTLGNDYLDAVDI